MSREKVLTVLKKLALAPELYLALLLVIFVLIFTSLEPKIGNAVLVRGGEPVEFAWKHSEKMDKGEKFQVEFDFSAGSLGSWELHVIPDDCIEAVFVNGKELELKDTAGICDYRNGVKILASDFPKAGNENHFQINLRNKNGPAGIRLMAKAASLGSALLTLFTMLFLLALFGCLLRRMQMPVPLLAAVLLATLLHLSYALETNYEERTYDVKGHVEYVKYLVQTGETPEAGECWACYHPPVYYEVASLAWRLGAWLGVQPERAVQWLSFLVSFFVLALGVQALRSVLHGKALFVASLLWLFWPVNTLASARIGNDILFYLGHVLCFFGALRYLAGRDCKFLALSALGSWLAYWTKSTGFVTIAVFWLAFALGYFPRESLKPRAGEVAPFVVAVLLLLSVALQLGLSETDLVGNAGRLNSKLKVDSAAQNFLFFDFKDFLTTTAPSSWEDKGGRQFLLNYMAKTSLFGEFKVADTWLARTAATLLCFSFLGLVIFALVGFWKKVLSKIDLFVLGNGGLFLAAMVYFRVKYPYSCSSDFRYVVPALLSFVPFAGCGICGQAFSAKWRVLGGILAAAFLLSSTLLALTYG